MVNRQTEDVINASSLLTESLRRAAEAHHEFETKQGKPDPNWETWYAQFMIEEGLTLQLSSSVDAPRGVW